MKKNTAKQKEMPRNNVLSIADNPRFQPKTSEVFIPNSVNRKDNTFSVFTLSSSIFGFMEGDQIVCRTNFNPDQIGAGALVVVNGKLKVAATVQNAAEISGVVVSMVREVKND